MLKLKRKIRIAVRLSMFLRSWWNRHVREVENMVLSDEKMDFLTKLIKPQVKEEKPTDMLFDVSEFKANKNQKLSHEARRILTVLPQYRTDSDVHYARIALRAHKEIANCPVRMQTLIAKYGMLETFEAKRCIVKQGHPPEAFYYIFYGTVAVTKDDGPEKKVECLLEKGESFGELSIANNENRQSSVISKTEIQLISIKKEVYEDAFMSGGSKRITDPDHDQFIRSLPFLNGWPTELLNIDSKQFVFTYFLRGTVIVRDSHHSEWVYIIKSGSVDVLKKLHKSKTTIDDKTGRQKQICRPEREKMEAFLCGGYFKYCEERNITVPPPVTADDQPAYNRPTTVKPFYHARRCSQSAPPISFPNRSQNKALKSRNGLNTASPSKTLSKLMNKTKLTKTIWDANLSMIINHYVLTDLEDELDDLASIAPEEFCPPSEKIESPTEGKRTYLDDLNQGKQKKGLADLVLGEQPNMCLISNGAECLMIKKDFYMDHCPQSLLRKLLQIVGPYPEEEDLQKDLAIKLNWDAQKKAILNGAITDIQHRLSRVGPARFQ
ncbi:uncharacterized protein [Watersipora subatra]|uniref:uncharacterized protein n=1 Tax=Watersipora subatra TaxID=2589382 RepID=UPI00355AEED9